MKGGTTFHFVDAEPTEALALARELADGGDVRIGGGVATVRQFLAADLIDHLYLVVVPIVLGRGERLWDGLEGIEEQPGLVRRARAQLHQGVTDTLARQWWLPQEFSTLKHRHYCCRHADRPISMDLPRTTSRPRKIKTVNSGDSGKNLSGNTC